MKFYTSDFPRLAAGDAVSSAIGLMRERSLTAVPVIDAAGGCIGMLRLKQLLAKVLPASAAMLGDLAFVSNDVEHLRQRLQAIESRCLVDFIDRNCPRLAPDTPLTEAMFLINQHEAELPVIDASGILLGVASPLTLLAALDREDD